MYIYIYTYICYTVVGTYIYIYRYKHVTSYNMNNGIPPNIWGNHPPTRWPPAPVISWFIDRINCRCIYHKYPEISILYRCIHRTNCRYIYCQSWKPNLALQSMTIDSWSSLSAVRIYTYNHETPGSLRISHEGFFVSIPTIHQHECQQGRGGHVGKKTWKKHQRLQEVEGLHICL